jgi:hypothetical protein
MVTVRSSLFATPLTARFATRFAGFVMMVGAILGAASCGKDGSDLGRLCPSAPMRVTTSPALTAAEFCQLYLETCTGVSNPAGGYTTLTDCETAYARFSFESTRECRSYHLCNSASYDTPNVVVHCMHAVGIGMCADSAL